MQKAHPVPGSYSKLPLNHTDVHSELRYFSAPEPGVRPNQEESHRISGIDRRGGHLLQVPSDTLIPTHHFYGTLKGSINGACTRTDTHTNQCAHTCTYTHSFILSLGCPALLVSSPNANQPYTD